MNLLCKHVCVCVHARMCVYICLYVCIYICVHMCVRVCVYTCIIVTCFVMQDMLLSFYYQEYKLSTELCN